MIASSESTAMPGTALARLSRVASFIVEPSKVYELEKRHPDALLPFVVLTVVMLLATVGMVDVTINTAMSSLPGAVRADLATEVSNLVHRNLWISVAITPLVMGARVLAIACFLYLIASFASSASDFEEGNLHRSISIVIYSSFALAIEELASFVTMWFIGMETINTPWEAEPILGMHYLVSDPIANPVLFVVLQRVNPFTILYGLLLALGMRRVFGTSWTTGISAAALTVLAGIATIALFAAIRS